MKHRFQHRFLLLCSLVVMVGVFFAAARWLTQPVESMPNYGVTFSTVYAETLGLDYQEAYRALVEELGVRDVRLPIYWSSVETEAGVQDWSQVDWLIQYSEEHAVRLTPVVGVKVPRWPECFAPTWTDVFDAATFQQEAQRFTRDAVARLDASSAVIRFQVENEPFFPFGECRTMTRDEWRDRVDLVRAMTDKPLQVTVSGESGPWLDAAQAADVLGVSLYRETWNNLTGYFTYPLTPEYYRVRVGLINPSVSTVLISELQAEPWFSEPIQDRSPAAWYETFPVEQFEEHIAFTEETGVSEVYLWGAEWWYYLHLNGESRLWEYADTLFK